jgi:DNA-binding response OmpR family regulator
MNPSSLRILLAEDDTLLASDLEACLREAGHEVMSVAACGDAALNAARLLQPDVVVLNVRMRGPRDGRAVAAELRAGRPVPVPVVFIKGRTSFPITRLDETTPLAEVLTTPLVGLHLCQALNTAMSEMWQ